MLNVWCLITDIPYTFFFIKYMKMKMKLTNKIRNIIVIVLIGALIFVILGAFNYNYQEGYKDSSKNDILYREGYQDSSNNDVPKCSDSLDKDDEQNMYDNWFLKTKMVPPVCPTCPYYFPLNKDEDKKDDKYDEDKHHDTKYDESENQNDNSVNQKLINKNDNSVNNQNDNSVNQSSSVNQSQAQSADKKWNNLFGNNSITFGGNTTQPNYNTSQLGSLAGSGQAQANNSFGNNLFGSGNPTQTGGPAVSTPAQVGKESCPPCPACERCPEPAFECKKVPNYRSQSMDNYMPLPVLNDFSRF